LAEQKSNRRNVMRLAVAGAVAVVAVGIYVSLDAESNTADAACAATTERAASLDEHAVGQVAAFRVSSAPDDLSDLAFRNAAGDPMTIADFSGRVVLVNLWATWCAPCREEMPALDQLEAEFGGEDFQVLAVSLDTSNTPGGPRAFLEEYGIDDLDLYVDPTARLLSQIQRIGLRGGLPTTMLVDEQGCTLGLMEGPADWAGPDAVNLIEAALAGEG